jgi:hypothetical protein
MASEDMIQHLLAAMVQDAPTPVGGNRAVEHNEALRAKLTVLPVSSSAPTAILSGVS